MKYLIYCGPGIGDFVLVLPMAFSIRVKDPNGYIKIITTSSRSRMYISKELFRFQNIINDIDYYSASEKWHSLSFLLSNGIKMFDYGFVLQYTDNDHTSVFPSYIVNIASKKTCGIKITSKKQIKYDYYVDRHRGVRIADYPKFMLKYFDIPFVEKYNSLLDTIKIKEQQPYFVYDNTRKAIALCMGAAVVSMNIYGNIIRRNTKHWDYKNWLNLSNLLSKEGYNVFLLGGQKEYEEINSLLSFSLQENVFNFMGRCSIIESLSILNLSDIVVGVDTGLMHCAGVLNIPSLTLFGCTDYQEYLPFGNKSQYLTAGEVCSPCFGTEMAVLCENRKCMHNITVNMVFDRILNILNNEKNNEYKPV